MLSIRSKLFKNRKGFTLIELIVVIAILAILAVLAVPRFIGTLESARQRTDDANIRTVRSALSLYTAENPTATPPADLGALETALVPDYIETWELDADGLQYYDSVTYTPGTATTAPTIVGNIS